MALSQNAEAAKGESSCSPQCNTLKKKNFENYVKNKSWHVQHVGYRHDNSKSLVTVHYYLQFKEIRKMLELSDNWWRHLLSVTVGCLDILSGDSWARKLLIKQERFFQDNILDIVDKGLNKQEFDNIYHFYYH